MVDADERKVEKNNGRVVVAVFSTTMNIIKQTNSET